MHDRWWSSGGEGGWYILVLYTVNSFSIDSHGLVRLLSFVKWVDCVLYFYTSIAELLLVFSVANLSRSTYYVSLFTAVLELCVKYVANDWYSFVGTIRNIVDRVENDTMTGSAIHIYSHQTNLFYSTWVKANSLYGSSSIRCWTWH